MKLIKSCLRSSLNDKSLSNLMKIALESPASVERNFSQMKLIKSCLRSSLNDKSLSNLMKIALESPVELTDSHLEEIVDVWNRKSRRIRSSLGELDTM